MEDNSDSKNNKKILPAEVSKLTEGGKPTSILEQMRESQNFDELVGVTKKISYVRVGKPRRLEFVRVRHGREWQITASFLEYGEHNDLYYVHREVLSEVAGEVSQRTLFLSITRVGDIFLWPTRHDKDDRKVSPWNTSARAAVREATMNWVRVLSNRNTSSYETFIAKDTLPEPVWPDMKFAEIVDIAFSGKIIDSPNHPILKDLRGER